MSFYLNKDTDNFPVDRGYRGIKEYKSATIHVPKPDENITKEKRKDIVKELR